MGVESVLLLTLNSATKREQEHYLRRGIEKLETDLLKRWAGYKKPPHEITRGLMSIHSKSRCGAYLALSVREGRLRFHENSDKIRRRSKRMGKSLIFSNMVDAETVDLIDTYHYKTFIDDDFQLLKDQSNIRFRPIRHWTDTKIRAYAFCCVLAMTIMRDMQWKAQQAGYKMSPRLFKDELSDIREVVMAYGPNQAKRKIFQRSAVQNKLSKEFKLDEIEEKYLIH